MRHEGAHDGDGLALGQARRRVVQRLVEAVAAARAEPRKPREIARAAPRIDHRRQRRRVGRHDVFVAEAALQPEPGNAEIRVLVGELQVAGVVGGFRDAPRHAERRAVFDLPADDQAAGLLEQAAAGARITSDGIRYSNIEPDQEISARAVRPA
jgi:hypothetical protein